MRLQTCGQECRGMPMMIPHGRSSSITAGSVDTRPASNAIKIIRRLQMGCSGPAAAMVKI